MKYAEVSSRHTFRSSLAHVFRSVEVRSGDELEELLSPRSGDVSLLFAPLGVEDGHREGSRNTALSRAPTSSSSMASALAVLDTSYTKPVRPGRGRAKLLPPLPLIPAAPSVADEHVKDSPQLPLSLSF